MPKRNHERGRPKVFPGDPGGIHFDAYYDKETDDRRAHERGQELKTLTGMGERRKAWAEAREFPVQTTSRAPVTLPRLKWGRDD